MIPNGLLTQIAMMGLSVGIFFTYLQPTFSEVKAVQDTILTYQEERSKVEKVNIKLNELVLKSEDVTPEQRKALDVYVPSEVDVVAVQRDLLLIAEGAGIELLSLGGAEAKEAAVVSAEEGASTRSKLVPYDFEISFDAPYESIKSFLALIEKNNYPLTLTRLSISSTPEEGQEGTVSEDLSATISLRTYALEFIEQAQPEEIF